MQNSSRSHQQFLHPYLFILKEGNNIQSDFLDYSLLLLQMSRPEILHTPHHYLRKEKVSNPLFQLLKK